MALISCPECSNTVSDKAEKCPHCGVAISRSFEVDAIGTALTTTQLTSKRLKLHSIISLIAAAVGFIWMISHSESPDSDPPLTLIASLSLFLLGLAWWGVTKIRIWWHHR